MIGAIWYAGAMNVLAIVVLLTVQHWEAPIGLAAIYSPFLVTSILAHVLLKRRRRAGLWLAGFAALIYIITPFLLGLFFITIPLVRASVFMGRLPKDNWMYDPGEETEQPPLV